VSVRALEVAMEQAEMYLKSRDHEDIDNATDNVSTASLKVQDRKL
jgi:ribosomal protein S10